MFEFIQLVNDIAEAYFEDGIYQPHIGELNAMRLYYNDKNNADIVDAAEFAEIVKDEKFVSEYFAAISERSDKLDFIQAYDMAMDIVDTKKSSLGNFLDLANSWLSRLGDVVSQENIDKLSEIAGEIKDGEISNKLADKVAETLKE